MENQGTKNNAQIIQSEYIVTYTPGHEIGKSPIVLFMEEQMTDTPAERLLIISVIYDRSSKTGMITHHNWGREILELFTFYNIDTKRDSKQGHSTF